MTPMNSKLTAIQRLRIQNRHRLSIENYGYQPQALFWSTQETQEIRFQKLIEILPKSFFKSDALDNDQAWSLLDVGCGFADLHHYMGKQNLFPDYTGIDLSPEMVRGVKGMAPELKVFEGELSDFCYATEQFDYVMLSGALNEVVETQVEGLANQQGEYAKSVVRQMYEISRLGVAFNLLDRRFSWHRTRTDLQSFYPQEIIEYCQSFATQVTFVDNYLENDFTIYLYKQTNGHRSCLGYESD